VGSVTIRRLSDETKLSVRREAAAKGRSVEAELRDLIERTYGRSEGGGKGPLAKKPGESSMAYLLRIAPEEGPFDAPARDQTPPEPPRL
jgi:plasmid stability protein